MWSRLAVLLFLVAACSAPPALPSSVPSSPPPPATPSEPALGTDLAWAQLTIALNERALKTFSLVRERAADTRLVSLADELATAHTDENVQLKTLLRGIGAPVDNPHTGHDMPGMATAQQLTAMSAARGEEFDRLFTDSLRRHLTQCRDLARSMLESGKLPDALALAAAIESARAQALTRL